MIYIIAGNIEEANNYRKSRNLQSKEVFYVVSENRLMGKRITTDDEVQCIGTYYRRGDIKRILLAVECCRMAAYHD